VQEKKGDFSLYNNNKIMLFLYIWLLHELLHDCIRFCQFLPIFANTEISKTRIVQTMYSTTHTTFYSRHTPHQIKTRTDNSFCDIVHLYIVRASPLYVAMGFILIYCKGISSLYYKGLLNPYKTRIVRTIASVISFTTTNASIIMQIHQ